MRNQYEDFKKIYSEEINKIQFLFDKAIREKTLKIEKFNEDSDRHTFLYVDHLQDYLEESLLKNKDITKIFRIRTEGETDIILTQQLEDKAISFRFLLDTLPKPYIKLHTIELYRANENVHCTYCFHNEDISFNFVTPNIDINNYFNSTFYSNSSIPFSSFDTIKRPEEYFEENMIKKAKKINELIKILPDTLYEILYEGKRITNEDKETINLLSDINIDNEDFEDITINIEDFIKKAQKLEIKDKIKI